MDELSMWVDSDPYKQVKIVASYHADLPGPYLSPSSSHTLRFILIPTYNNASHNLNEMPPN